MNGMPQHGHLSTVVHAACQVIGKSAFLQQRIDASSALGSKAVAVLAYILLPPLACKGSS